MPFDPSQAARTADFIQFAYNMYAVGGLTPAPDAGIDHAGYKLIFWLIAKDLRETAFYGYIAQSKTVPGEFILAIRGTEDLAEWILDFSTLPVPFHASTAAGFVSLGFQSIEQSFMFVDGPIVAQATVRSSLADVVGRIAAQTPITSFAVLGHSLGGALATLAAAELAVRNSVGIKPALSVSTYASPSVGLLDFSDWFAKNLPNSIRIWNTLDIVPQTPPLPYIHVKPAYQIVQTQKQMEELNKTPVCEHHLENYQWLLDPAQYALTADCAAEQDQTISAATRTAGAQALAAVKTAGA